MNGQVQWCAGCDHSACDYVDSVGIAWHWECFVAYDQTEGKQ